MNIESKYKNRNRLHYKNSNNNMPYNIIVKHLSYRQNLFNDLMAVVLTYYIII